MAENENVVSWTERDGSYTVNRSVSYGNERTAHAVAEALKSQTENIESVKVNGQDA